MRVPPPRVGDARDDLARRPFPSAASVPTIVLMTEDADVQSLLEAEGRDEQRALADLFARHRDRLRRMVAFRLDARLLGRVSPSDILQEAYLDALKRLPHFRVDPSVPFFVWLRTVTLQRLIDVHRHHMNAAARDAGREVHMNLADNGAASTERIAELVSQMTSPSGVARRVELVARVREAVDRLDPIDREVLVLRHFEELTNRETAAALQIQPAAASKRYLRALERLKEALGPDGAGE